MEWKGRTMCAPCIEGGCHPEDACRRTMEDAMAVTVERKGAAHGVLAPVPRVRDGCILASERSGVAVWSLRGRHHQGPLHVVRVAESAGAVPMTRHLGFGDYRDVLRELRAIANSDEVTSADWRAWGAEMRQDVPPAAL